MKQAVISVQRWLLPCPAYLCGLFKSIQGGLWICPVAGSGDDRDANDGPRTDGPKIWNFHIAWRHIGSDVSARAFSDGYILEATHPV